MPLSELHKKKLKKNLLILALVLAWCALIWMVAMIKIANAAEIVPWQSDREAHRQHSEETVRQWHEDDWNGKEAAREKFFHAREEQRTAHQDRIGSTRQSWNQDWADKEPKRQAVADKREQQRTTHQQQIEDKPQPWWENWEERLNP